MNNLAKQLDTLIDVVLSGRYGTKNRAELIQSLESLRNPMGVSEWIAEGKKYGYDVFFKKRVLEEVENELPTVIKSGFPGDVDYGVGAKDMLWAVKHLLKSLKQ